MTGAIAHRGPDDEQIHLEPGVALGARRLSIVDLAGGRQPISNEDGSIWVTQNGEIFEYPELQAELAGARPSAGDAVRHRAVGPPVRRPGRRVLREDARPVCRGALGPQSADGRSWAATGWGSARCITPRPTAGCSGARRSRRCSPRGWSPRGPTRRASTSSSTRSAPARRGRSSRGSSRSRPGHFLRVRDGRVELKKYWDLDFPDAGQERRLDDPTPLVDELEFLMRQAVERRLRGDVPVVSYISGGLDSTVVLGLSSRQRGYAVPSFTIGLDRAGPDERSHAAESAAALGSTLVDRDDEPRRHRRRLSRADPGGRGAGDGLVGRLPDAAGARGPRAGLQGRPDRRGGRRSPGRLRLVQDPEDPRCGSTGARSLSPSRGAEPGPGVDRRQRPIGPTCWGFTERAPPSKTFTTSWARPGRSLYSARLWDRLAGHSAYDDLDITNDRFTRWHPLNQSLYVGYKVMLAGLLLLAKGDRVAMNSSVETRYPLLDDDVIAFCASIAPEYKLHGLTDKWLLRQVAARTLPPRIANRPKTMFRASRSEAFLAPDRPALGRPAPQPRVAQGNRLVRPRRRSRASAPPRSGSRGSPPSGSSWT